MTGLITIQGQVINAVSIAPLAGVKVIARREGTKIQQETDKSGKYELHLVPGLWRIGVWALGFNEPDAYMYNFTSDTVGIDFRLQEGYSISGLVLTQQNGKPARGVIVEAEAVIEGKTVFKQELTGAGGKYRFSGLRPGQWQVQGSRGESKTGKEIRTIGPDAINVNLTLARQMTLLDWRWGMGFFATLGVLLVILAGVYLWAHSSYAPLPEPELTALIGQIEQASQIAAGVVKSEEGSELSLQTLRSTVAALRENWTSVSKTIISITEGQNEQATLLVSRAETAINADNAEDVELALVTLISVLENQRSIYFWSEPPRNYLEVIFWSLAGILVNLLITSGYYLRRKRFYAEGIWMHVSHLISVPVMALVVVFLISQIKLTIQMDESEVVLNVNDPRLLAAISFAIALRPWAMLEFVREAGSRFFSQIQSRIAGGSQNKGQQEND
jgi:flagellar biosynthesis protein FliQ/5-hydroxyisourate hydrolase-like protein (transthyretin family)